ncbi:MAG: hypothetical protein HY423_07645 [Candidatus Lambdaproteobacteria bacterium]|nr:hypothetical protein [Candidatus Lambdaproteobacteria bacterium]
MPNELVDFWQSCPLDAPPFAHPGDLAVLQQQDGRNIDAEPKDFDSFVAGSRFGDFDDHRLHLSLLPIPYGGNLERAKIVILLLNPGFSYTDYWAETRVPQYRHRLKENIRQSFRGVKFPFLWLDPEFCWHSGFAWWERKLRDVLTVIAKKEFRSSYLKALQDLSTKLAHLELVPYHSPAFRAHALIRQLRSVELAQQFVRDVLVPKANAGNLTLIVTRQSATWGIPPRTKNLVVYSGGETRGASLSRKSQGGKAILRHYGIE